MAFNLWVLISINLGITMTKRFKVYLENNAAHTVIAKTPEEAIEVYYDSIGHHLKICGCFDEKGNEVGIDKGIKKPLDRIKIVRVIKVEEV